MRKKASLGPALRRRVTRDLRREENDMRRLSFCITAAVAALVTVAGIVAGTTAAQAPGPPTGTREFVSLDRESRFRFVDNRPFRRESAGDMVVLTGRLRTAGDNRRVGRYQAVFVATRRGNFERRFVAQGSGSFTVADGDIVVQGVIDDSRKTDRLAIVGGTRAYAGARGTLAVTETRTTTRFVFAFTG
jgi:hypothetical protein